MAITAIRTVIIYIFIITAMRIMGKRQLGELQPVELVVTLLISDLAAVPMQESGMPLLNGLIPILILVSLELLLSGAMLKLPWVSHLITGNPITIIRDGQLDQKALKKLRMTVEDLTENLRGMDYFDIEDSVCHCGDQRQNQRVSQAGQPARHLPGRRQRSRRQRHAPRGGQRRQAVPVGAADLRGG